VRPLVPHLALDQAAQADDLRNRHCKSLASGEPKHSAFQRFAVVDALLVSGIPDSLSWDEATVLPLGLSTAASGLYPKRFLALPYPKADSPNPDGKGKVLLVYGGSSSVGASAIQLAAASGVRVVTTCSPANFDLVKSLGAAAAFDYRTPKDELVSSLVAAIEKQGSEYAGAFDAISEHGSVELCAQVALKAFGGSGQKFVAATLPPPQELPEGISSEWSASSSHFHPLAPAVPQPLTLPSLSQSSPSTSRSRRTPPSPGPSITTLCLPRSRHTRSRPSPTLSSPGAGSRACRRGSTGKRRA